MVQRQRIFCHSGDLVDIRGVMALFGTLLDKVVNTVEHLIALSGTSQSA